MFTRKLSSIALGSVLLCSSLSVAAQNNSCLIDIVKENAKLQALQLNNIKERHFTKSDDGTLSPKTMTVFSKRNVMEKNDKARIETVKVEFATISLEPIEFLQVVSAKCEDNKAVYEFGPAPVPQGIQALMSALEPVVMTEMRGK